MTRNSKTRASVALIRMALVAGVSIGFWLLVPSLAVAHCDTLDGPVVRDAKMALEKGDVTPVLKWVKKEYEKEIRAGFKKTLAVRVKGIQAKELADIYFFETLVRLHRAGEGAPYTGLKPAGTELEPGVAAADRALETRSIDALMKLVSEEIGAGIRKRFHRTLDKKSHAEESVEAGREFVETYVEFVHYVERLHLDATGSVAHQAVSGGAGAEGRHKH